MANTIRIKRSTGSSAPSSLENAELAYSEGNNVLWYGTGTGGAGGSATAIEAIGGDGFYATLTSAQTVSGNKTFTGTLDFSGATVQTFTCAQNLTVTGNLTVNGTTTTISSSTVNVEDKNLELGKVSTPTDTTADGGGITLKGATDKTFNWVDSTDSWTSSEHIEVASGKTFRINGNNVLNQTTLGSTVVGSSLTGVGTISSGTWAATDVAVAHGGTGASTAAAALVNLGLTATAAELNALDGITSTVGELNIVDGSTSATSTTLAAADRMVINDNGTMVQVALSDLVTFLENGSVSGFDLDGGTY
jgi:hypothetical protein